MLITNLMPSEKIIPVDVDVIAEKFKLFVAKMFSSFIFNKQYSKIVMSCHNSSDKGLFLAEQEAVDKSNEIIRQLNIQDIRVCIIVLSNNTVDPMIIFELKTDNAVNFIVNQMDDFENYIKNNVTRFSDKQIQTLLDRFDGSLSTTEFANFMELLLETISKGHYKVICPSPISLDKLNNMLMTKIYDIEMCDK